MLANLARGLARPAGRGLARHTKGGFLCLPTMKYSPWGYLAAWSGGGGGEDASCSECRQKCSHVL